MLTAEEVREALAASRQRLTDLTAAQDVWEEQWGKRTPETESRILASRPSLHDRSERCAEVAHLQVLLDILTYQPGVTEYAETSKPAFAMTYSELQDHLAAWIVETVTIGVDYPFDAQRLLLGWCAQLLVIPTGATNAPNLYPDGFMDVARSIYAYAIAAEVQLSVGGVIGRNGFDARLILALTAFPFLEGMARRRLSHFLSLDGRCQKQFTVIRADGKPKAYQEGRLCSDVRDALCLLETTAAPDLAQRLTALRQKIARVGPSQGSELLVPRAENESDLYNLIYWHRNSNLHGGKHVAHIGLVALLLATMIAISEIEHGFDQRSELARVVVRHHTPLNPTGRWSHLALYPVDFPLRRGESDIHRWERWNPSR